MFQFSASTNKGKGAYIWKLFKDACRDVLNRPNLVVHNIRLENATKLADRGMDDEPAVVEGLGLEYVAFPIASRDEISFDAARKLDQLLETYDGPVLLHCGSGNRVGAVLALRESLNGADDEAAIAFGKTAGLTRLEDLVRERLTKE